MSPLIPAILRASEFYKLCAKADWHYSYSDDPEVYRKGKDYQDAFETVANKIPTFKLIYAAFKYHHESISRGIASKMYFSPQLEDFNLGSDHEHRTDM